MLSVFGWPAVVSFMGLLFCMGEFFFSQWYFFPFCLTALCIYKCGYVVTVKFS